MSAAPMATNLDCLREARDSRQRTYAHVKQRILCGLASQKEYDEARAAYLLAQSEYRAAQLAARRWGDLPITVTEPEWMMGRAKARVTIGGDHHTADGNTPDEAVAALRAMLDGGAA